MGASLANRSPNVDPPKTRRSSLPDSRKPANKAPHCRRSSLQTLRCRRSPPDTFRNAAFVNNRCLPTEQNSVVCCLERKQAWLPSPTNPFLSPGNCVRAVAMQNNQHTSLFWTVDASSNTSIPASLACLASEAFFFRGKDRLHGCLLAVRHCTAYSVNRTVLKGSFSADA